MRSKRAQPDTKRLQIRSCKSRPKIMRIQTEVSKNSSQQSQNSCHRRLLRLWSKSSAPVPCQILKWPRVLSSPLISSKICNVSQLLTVEGTKGWIIRPKLSSHNRLGRMISCGSSKRQNWANEIANLKRFTTPQSCSILPSSINKVSSISTKTRKYSYLKVSKMSL